jgi:hypothetical protein
MSLLTDLVAHWKLDEESGTRVDSHGSSDLTDNNTVLYEAGKFGNAAALVNANSEYLSSTDNAALSVPSNQSFTFTLWFKAATFVNSGLLGKATGFTASSTEYYLTSASSSIVRIIASDGTTVVTTSITGLSLSAGTWYFLAGWYDSVAQTLNLQLDNGTPVSQACVNGSQDLSSGFAIGRVGAVAGFSFNGAIDSVSFWKRVLTSDERTALYNSGDGLDYDEWDAGGETFKPYWATQQQVIGASV